MATNSWGNRRGTGLLDLPQGKGSISWWWLHLICCWKNKSRQQLQTSTKQGGAPRLQSGIPNIFALYAFIEKLLCPNRCRSGCKWL